MKTYKDLTKEIKDVDEAFDMDKFKKAMKGSGVDIRTDKKLGDVDVKPRMKSQSKGELSSKSLKDLDKTLAKPFDKDYRRSDDKNVFQKYHSMAATVQFYYKRMSPDQKKKYEPMLKKQGYISEGVEDAEGVEDMNESNFIDVKRIKDKAALKKIEKIDKTGDDVFYNPSTKDVKSFKELKKEYGNRKKINTESGYLVVMMGLTPASRGNFSLGY